MTNTTLEKQKSPPISYKDLIVWQKSIEFAILVIDLAEKLSQSKRHFRQIEQLEAAVTSIPMNIAEGKGRNSTKEYRHFLMIARGSLYETMTILEIFRLKGWVSQEDYLSLEIRSDEIGKMINGLYGKLRP